MNKRNRPELDDQSPCSGDQKTVKKSKSKAAANSKNNSGIKKKRKSDLGQSPYINEASLLLIQRKPSDNISLLTPLLKRSCPNNLLRIDSVKKSQKSLSPDSCTPELIRTSLRSSSKQLRTENAYRKTVLPNKRRNSKPSLVAIVSSSQLISRKKKSSIRELGRNHSSPDLSERPILEKSKHRINLSSTESSLHAAAEFPDVTRIYERIARCDAPAGSGSRKLLKHQTIHSSAIRSLRHSLFALRQKRGKTFKPLSKLSSSTGSLSAPITPPSLPSNSVKVQKTNLLPPQGIVSSPSGWGTYLRGTKGLHNSSSQSGNSNRPTLFPDSPAQAPQFNHQSDQRVLSKDFDGEACVLDSCEKCMNQNTKQYTMTNRKNGQQPSLQYQTGRLNPRLSANFSSSFCLPYGLGNRVQSSPVTAPAIPPSSSFHGGPLESLQLMSERASRQQNQYTATSRQQRKYLERQKMKMLKPLGTNKTQSNMTKLYDLATSEFSAAILPDHTTSYRLTHDVSFDEGSRYKTTGDFPHGLKGREDVRGHHSPAEGSNARVNGTLGPPRHDGRISVGRDHSASNNISFKETVPLSLIRMEDRFAADLPPTTSPSSPALSTLNAAPNSSSTFIPPPSASRQQHPSQGNGGTITTFRLHKEKQNWNYRLGDLSINGGGYYSATVSSRQDIQNHMNSLTVSSVSSNQRNSQTRERTVLAPKSRMSSRYSSKAESANASASFSDPCIASPPSFQQRLTDLSLLESETIKYERNRKLRRKKNQDKDS